LYYASVIGTICIETATLNYWPYSEVETRLSIPALECVISGATVNKSDLGSESSDSMEDQFRNFLEYCNKPITATGEGIDKAHSPDRFNDRQETVRYALCKS